RPVCTSVEALWNEFTAIHGELPPPPKEQTPDASMDSYLSAAAKKGPSAICLSGGGIRSAAFSLGVIQALARKGLLTQFDYLSTVSGGGYIGGWLSALIHAHNNNVGEVQDLLAQRKPSPELTALRSFTTFLTPKPGLTSADSWAGVVLWLR